ncbi:hypothetical protein DAPPUDRAFT_23773, partial [Daphnia pulex]
LTFLFSQVGLIGLVVAYSAAGAVLFEWLEADQEIEPRRKILQIRLDCLDDLNRLNRQQFDNNSDELWAIKAGALLKVEGYDGKEVDDAERQWSVSGSLLYSITVITTIGYGNLAPKTGPGKVVTIIYALIGIPLMLLCLSNLGSFMASSFQFAFGKLYCCFWCSSQKCCCNNSNYRRQRRRQHHQQQLKTLTQPDGIIESAKVNQQHQHGTAGAGPTVVNIKGQQQQQQRVPVSVVLAFLVGYICIGAAVFSAWEEWSYLDGAYFSFITLSTIGFGDLVPGSKVLEQGETKLVACIVYLVVGLAMIAMSFNLVQEEV